MKPIATKNNRPVYELETLWKLTLDTLPPYPFYDDGDILYDENAPFYTEQDFEKTRPLTEEEKKRFTFVIETSAKSKRAVTLRLDADIIDALKSRYAKGYQTQINRILREQLGLV
jgi:uncharacterized protein (DUF4415 family)